MRGAMAESHGRTDAELVNIMSGGWGLGTARAERENRISGRSASLGSRPAANYRKAFGSGLP